MQIYIVDDLCSTIFLRVDERQISCQNLPVYVALQNNMEGIVKNLTSIIDVTVEF